MVEAHNNVFIWALQVHAVLAHLEPLNVDCRIRLTKLLSDVHKVQLWPDDTSPQAGCGRGSAVFYAFDPWDTCLRLPPGSFRYFYAAEKANILNAQEALNLSRLLLDRCRQVSACYDGHFSGYFRQNHVRIFLQHAQDLDYLLRTGLALGSACADTLFEACPWPVVPERHFVTKAFSDVRIEREIYRYVQDPWSSWTEALDVTCFGPWLGLRPEQVSAIMEQLHPCGDLCPTNNAHLSVGKYSAHKVVIPFFTNGFQGIIAGFFAEVPDEQKDAIFSTLWQFGQTMSDAYSIYRGQQFLSVLESQCEPHMLARAVINLVAPVKTVIVELGGEQAGYSLKYESGYWAGYKIVEPANLEILKSSCRIISLPGQFRSGFTLYIEPVSGLSLFDPEFSFKRMENYVAQFFRLASRTGATSAPTLQQVRSLLDKLIQYVADENASLAKWRQYYVVDKVIKNWPLGGVNITNNELKTFLEAKVGHPLKNGYQISSYIKEIESTFEQKLKISKTRTGVMLTWSQTQ